MDTLPVNWEKDYQDICTIDTPINKRNKLNIGNIWANQIQCNNCKEIIRSKNRHHMKWCKCKTVAVDGGSWYLKRAGTNYTEMSIMFNNVEKGND